MSPAVVEIPVGKQNAVDGHFDVVNNTLEPMAVIVEAKSFTINRDGVAVFTPLRPELQLQLSATGMRLPPQQRRTIYYRVASTSFPAWFCIYSTLSPLSHGHGVQVAMELPHTVYLLRGPRATAQMVRLSRLKVNDGELHGTVFNDSPTLVRVHSLELSGPHAKKEEGGFPVLPGAERDFTMPAPAGANHLRVNTASFHLDATLP